MSVDIRPNPSSTGGAGVTSVNGDSGPAVVLDSGDISEGSNLYYTNARADARIAAADLTDLNDVNYTAGAGIDGQFLKYVDANNRWEAADTPSAPVSTVNTQTGDVVLDTDDISEEGGATNQYFTNARADARIAAADLTDLNDVNYTAGAGIDGQFLKYVDANNRWEAADTPSAPVSTVNTQTGDVVLDTDDISEEVGATNQYFTNARADARIAAADLTDLNDVNYTAGAGIDGQFLKYVDANNRWEAADTPSAPVSTVNTQTGDVVLDTDDISEEGGATNQYFTNARADARIAAADLTDLNDVNYTAGAGIDGQVLTYVDANNRWEAKASTGGGGFTYDSSEGSASFSATIDTHYSVNTSGASADITATLPSSAAGNSGQEIRFKLMDATHSLILAVQTGQLIEGTTNGTYIIDVALSAVTCVSNGSNGWEVI